ncbi:MAG: hypothetical protein ABGY09_06665 [Euryarchaeota archaeon]
MLRRLFRRRKTVKSRLYSIKSQVGPVDPDSVVEAIGGPMEEQPQPTPTAEEEREELEEEVKRLDSFIRSYSGRSETELVTAYPLYETIRVLASMGGGRRLRRAIVDVSAVRIPLLLASHNAVGPTSDLTEGLPPDSDEYAVVAPYHRVSLKPLHPGPLKVDRPNGEVIKRRWKRLPNVCSWGVEAIVVRRLWKATPVLVLVTDAVASLYGVYLSSMLDAPIMDVSYLWMYTKGKPIWEDERGRKRTLHWDQAETLRSLKPDYIVILGSVKRRQFKRVVRAIRSEVRSSTLIPVISRDHRELGEKLLKSIEDEVPMVGEHTHKVFHPEPPVARLVKDVTLIPLPTSAYNEVKALRFRPLTLEVKVEES